MPSSHHDVRALQPTDPLKEPGSVHPVPLLPPGTLLEKCALSRCDFAFRCLNGFYYAMMAVGRVSDQFWTTECFSIPKNAVVWEQAVENPALEVVSGGKLESFLRGIRLED